MQIDIDRKLYIYNSIPDNCPLCHHGIEPITIGSNVISKKTTNEDVLQLLYRCPRQDCQRAFIATYKKNLNYHGIPENEFSLKYTAPYSGKEADISNEIKSLSCNFKEIYGQAHTAEHFGLDQIAGVGYRKALEFLIKDYCISKHVNKKEEIMGKFLGVCINEFIDEVKIKECARRATWLGNDETHYIRKWGNKDIKDLKILIELTMSWIKTNILTEQYLSEMNNAT